MPRNRLPLDLRLLDKVSRYYYEQRLSEEEISFRLNLSRSKVSRLLKQAREAGIVQITILSPPGIYPEMELEIEQMYHLKEVNIVDVSEPTSRDTVARALGVAASKHLQDTIRERDVIGISWGDTLRSMVAALVPQNQMHSRVIQIIGGLGPPTAESHATDICKRMASALMCELIPLPAPGITSSLSAKDAFLQEPHVQRAFGSFSSITLAYVGIGFPSPNSVMMRDGLIMSKDDFDGILSQGAVGDIALRFFNKTGQPIQSDMDRRVIGITLEELKAINTVVGVAGGTEKVGAIKGALTGKLVDILITDQLTAKNILEG